MGTDLDAAIRSVLQFDEAAVGMRNEASIGFVAKGYALSGINGVSAAETTPFMCADAFERELYHSSQG